MAQKKTETQKRKMLKTQWMKDIKGKIARSNFPAINRFLNALIKEVDDDSKHVFSTPFVAVKNLDRVRRAWLEEMSGVVAGNDYGACQQLFSLMIDGKLTAPNSAIRK